MKNNKKNGNLSFPKFPLIYYNTYFLIKNIPPANTSKMLVPNIIYVASIPVDTDNITGASSISSSPGFLLSGVESLSGTPHSL